MKNLTAKMLKASVRTQIETNLPIFREIHDEFHGKFESLFILQRNNLHCYVSFQNHAKFDSFTVECAINVNEAWPSNTLPASSVHNHKAEILRFRLSRIIPGCENKDVWWCVSDNLLRCQSGNSNIQNITNAKDTQQAIDIQLKDVIEKLGSLFIPYLSLNYDVF